MAEPTLTGGLGWELAQILGVAAAIACLALCAIPVRPRQSTPDLTLALKRHELIGWAALGAVALHVIVLLVVDRRVVEHLKLTTPLYQWGGILAALALVILTVPAVATVRQRLWPAHRRFQALHVGFACILLPSMLAHIVATDRYVHGRTGAFVAVTISAAILGALLRARARRAGAPRSAGITARMAFGRNSLWVLGVVGLAILPLLALLLPDASLALREPLVRRGQPLREEFPHDKHRAVECVACHHNYTDKRGFDTCVACHRSHRNDLVLGPEARFHDFCLGCHRDPKPPLKKHGPRTGCSTCHIAPTS